MGKRVTGFGAPGEDPEAGEKQTKGKAAAEVAFAAVVLDAMDPCCELGHADLLYSTREIFDMCQAHYPSPFYFQSTIVDLLRESDHLTYQDGALVMWMFRKK